MWIRDVHVPDRLIMAHRDHRLVLFVGAGASIADPSSLPTFLELTKQIASESGIEMSDRDRDNPDRLLGDLDLDGSIGTVDVHRRVSDIVGIGSSRPNALHRAIVDLAVTSAAPRIITTNYDRHLSSLLGPMPEFRAPALPMGDDFEGVVYLHGTLEQEARFLVVTDRDFGRAYLTDAWAARFLERMFRKFTVLFIGYSHDDVVMSYLARGLPRDTERFVLTDEPDHAKWRRLGIEPISYPQDPGRTHAALPAALSRWGELSKWGLMDHERRVREILRNPLPLVPEDQSYLEDTLADDTRQRFFTKHATDERWLNWAQEQPIFARILDPKCLADDSSHQLAWWFVERFAMPEATFNSALRVLTSAGGTMSDALWLWLGGAIQRAQEPRPRHLDTWTVLLAEASRGRDPRLLNYSLSGFALPASADGLLVMLDELTRPQLAGERITFPGGDVRLRAVIRADDYWVRQLWENTLAPQLDLLAPDLLEIADHNIRHAYRILRAAGSMEGGFDPLSFSRSAIEAHRQNSPSHEVDLLIDLARDSLAHLLRQGSPAGIRQLDQWIGSDCALLRRLAIDAWSTRPDATPDQKLAWLRETNWLYDLQTHHEVFQLIRGALPDASKDARSLLLERVLSGPPGEDQYRDHRIHNLLVWMATAAPDFDEVTTAREELEAANSALRASSHPEFTSWHEGGAIGRQAPMEPSAFHDAIREDVSEALGQLLTYESQHSPWEGPTWFDALEVVTSTVAEWPEDGHVIIAALETERDTAGAIVGAVLLGWSKAQLDESSYRSAATAIGELLGQVALADSAAQFLLDQASREDKPSWTVTSDESRALADRIWAALADGSPPPQRQAPKADPLFASINSGAGKLAEFWVRSISFDWRRMRDEWRGLPEVITASLERMLHSSTQAGRLAQIYLAGQIGFIFEADQQWATQHLLPMFDWDEDAAQAATVWPAFLQIGRDSDRLLRAGLLDLYLKTVAHYEELAEDVQSELSRHLAAIAVYGELDPVESGWLRRFTASSPSRVTTRWIKEVTWLLEREESPELAETTWQRWMQSWWHDRLSSIPRVLDPSEASAVAEWAFTLSESFPVAADMALKQPAELGEHTDILYLLPNKAVVEDYPTEVVRLVTHILRSTTQTPFWRCDSLKELVQRVRGSIDRELTKELAEQALRLGCTDASSW